MALGEGGDITINGGAVTANGGNGAAGIGGGGDSFGAGGDIIIKGGTVTANGGSEAAGIGGGKNAESGSFSTGEDGKAFIIASSIADQKNNVTWSGVIFEGADGEVYGNQTLTENFEIPAEKTLTIPEGQTLTIPEGKTLTVGSGAELAGPGTVKLAIGGTLKETGGATITNHGTAIAIEKDGTTTTITPKESGEVSMTGGKVEVPAGSTVQTGNSGPEITIGEKGGAVGGDGAITVPEGGTVKVDDATITVPTGGGEVKPHQDGKVEVPAGSTVKPENGNSIIVPEGGGAVDPGTGNIFYTVTFDSQGGSTVASVTVLSGDKPTQPTDPAQNGYTFGGWYKEPSCTNAWKFDTNTVTENIILYAKWTRKSSSSGGSYTPSYKPTVAQPDEGGEVSVTPATPERGDKVTVTTKPEDGYKVDKIIVTDKDGKPVEVKDNGDGTFSFTQPTGKVEIEVIYKGAETEWANPFTEVDQGAWYYESVAYVVEKGLFYGTSETKFSPHAPMTRAMLMTVLARAEGVDTTAPAGGTWYDTGMKWTMEQGISDGTDPDGAITREQLAVMLYRYAGAPAAPNLVLDFTDADQVSDYAQDALRWAVEQGILTGKGGGILDPKGNATRAEVAAMLMRFLATKQT